MTEHDDPRTPLRIPDEAIELLEEEGARYTFSNEMVLDLGLEIDGIPQGVRLTGWSGGLAWTQVPLHFDERSTTLFSISLWQADSMTGAFDSAYAHSFAGIVLTAISVEDTADGLFVSSADESAVDLMIATAEELASIGLEGSLCPVCSSDGAGWRINVHPPDEASHLEVGRCLDVFWTRCTMHREAVAGDDDGNPAEVAGEPWERRGGVWGPV